MTAITWLHVAGGMVALLTGTVAFAMRKGGGAHVAAGTGFCVAMFVLGLTASSLAPFKSPPDSPVGGLMVCYFVATAWMAARRRSGTAAWFDKIACAFILLIAAAILFEGVRLALSSTPRTGPPGPVVLILLGSLCLLAGVSDLKFIRGALTERQRIARHLWRMCFAFFIATGSFFLGQQDVLPQSWRGSPLLFVPAFAPFALMVFWLVRIRHPAWRRSGRAPRRSGTQPSSLGTGAPLRPQ